MSKHFSRAALRRTMREIRRGIPDPGVEPLTDMRDIHVGTVFPSEADSRKRLRLRVNRAKPPRPRRRAA